MGRGERGDRRFFIGLYIRPWRADGPFLPSITTVPRLFCPHRLGHNSKGERRVLCYQYGGESESGLGPPGSPSNWRCIALEELSKVKLLRGPWRTAPNHFRPAHCVIDVDIDADDQPERAPQNGQ